MPSSCAPLSVAAPHALLKPQVLRQEFRGEKSDSTFHLFVNETDEEAELFWFYEGGQVKHGCIAPGSNVYVGTYTFHQWKVLGPGSSLLGVYGGASATIYIRANGCHIQINGLPAGQVTAPGPLDDVIHTPDGPYRKRGEALGLAIWAFDCVPDRAVEHLSHLTRRMLESSPAWVLQRLQERGAALALAGRDQGITDLPPHQFMKHMQGRDLDRTSRGLGGTLAVPVTSIGEENVTMVDDWLYPCQSIFVHEFGHAVLNLAMDPEAQRRLVEVYEAARQANIYPPGTYIMCNEQEYFATGTEAWFESTIRTDVNGGVNTREALRTKDPRLSALLQEVFGDGPWRYHQDCPVPLRMPTRKDHERREATLKSGKADKSATPPGVSRTASAAALPTASPGSGATHSPAESAQTPLLTGHRRAGNSSSQGGATPGAGPSGGRGGAQQQDGDAETGAGSGGRARRGVWEMATQPMAACVGGRPAKLARLGCRGGCLPFGGGCGGCGVSEAWLALGCLPCIAWLRQPKEKQ